MKVIIKVFFLFSLIASPLLVEKISACSTEYVPSIYQSFQSSSFVFAGKVIDSKIVKGEIVFRFEIKEVFKGSKIKEVEINIGEENMCEGGFLAGVSYLIYAHGKDEKRLYTYNFATRNVNLDDAEDQIYFLREFLKGKPEAQVYGSIVRKDENLIAKRKQSVKLENIKVLVEGNGKRFETVTNALGIFYFNKIPKGEYTIKPLLPDIYQSDFPHQEKFFVLASGKVTTNSRAEYLLEEKKTDEGLENLYLSDMKANGSYHKFSVYWKNRITGKVFDNEGKKLEAKVRVLPVSSPYEQIVGFEYQNDMGKYHFSGLTPAQYYLVAEITAPFNGKDKVRFFYPQAETPEKATIINIDKTSNFEFDLIVPVTGQKLEGKILWSDETPIAGNVKVFLSKSPESTKDELKEDFYDFESISGDSSFSLEGYVGAEYWIHTLVFAETLVNGELKSIKVNTKPINVKVEKISSLLKS
jgi:hypothetical protein